MTTPAPFMLNPRALVELIATDADALALLRSLVTPEATERRRPYMTPDEAADYLRCTRRRVYELCGDGRLSRHGEGRRLLLLRAEVEALAGGSGP